MKMTVTADNGLHEKALAAADPAMECADLFQEALKIFVRLRATERLICLGATGQDMSDIPR